MRRIFIVVFAATLFAASAITQKAQANGIVATWPVGHQPFGIAIDPSDGRVFVANSGTTVNPTVSVVNPAAGTVASLATSGTSDLVAVDSAARRLYSSNANSTLDVFDLANGARIATVAVGAGLGVAVDPATRRVYVAGGTGPFAVVDGVTNSVVATRSVPSGQVWFAVALDPGMHRVYVSNIDQTKPTLEVLDDRDLSLVSELPMPKVIRWGVAVDASRHSIYLAATDPAGSSNSSFYVLDPSSFAITQTTALTGFPFGIAQSPLTHRIYVTDAAANRVYELDDTTFAITSTTPLPWGPSLAAMHPDGRLYVAGYQGTGADVLAALAVASAPVVDSVTLSPDPPRVHDTLHAFAQGHDSQGYTMNQSAFRFEWSRNGGPFFPGMQDFSLDSAGARRGDTITVRVTLTDGGQVSAPKSASVVVADSAPIVTSVVLSDPSPTTNEILTATAAATDADNDPVTFAFTWKVNNVVRRTVSGPSRTDTFDLGVAGNGDRGDTVTVDVSASDGTLQSFGFAGAFTTVANSAPTVGVTLSSTTPTSGDVVTATASGQDPDHDSLAYTFTWTVNGAVRRTTVGANATDSFDLAVAGNGDRGDTVGVAVTVSDGSLESGPASANATVVNTPPLASVSLTPAAPTTNKLLSAAATASDADGDQLRYSFTWRVNGAVRRTSSGSNPMDSLDLGLAGNGSRGDAIVVELVVSDGTADSDVALATTTVADSAPTVTVSLNTTTPTTKSRLVATAVGSDADSDPVTFTYAWQINKKVKQTTTTTATTNAFDLAGRVNDGDVVTVTVTATDGTLTTTSATISTTVRNH